MVGDPSYLKYWVANFELIFVRSTSAVSPSKRSSMNTNRKSTLSNEQTMISFVAPKSPKGGSKTQNGRIRYKITLRLKKVCYKVSLCENCQQQSCKAFIGLTIRETTIGGGRPFLPEIFCQTDGIGAKWPIFNLFSLVAPQL